jgi:hypothetical protein
MHRIAKIVGLLLLVAAAAFLGHPAAGLGAG